MTVEVRALDAQDESQLEAAYEIALATMAETVPDIPVSRVDFLGRLVNDWPATRSMHLLAYRDGVIAGHCSLSLPQVDNTHLADLHIAVHPDHARRGVGRALWEAGVAEARGLDRHVLQGEYVTQLEGGGPRTNVPAAFAEAVGAKAALPEVRRRLDMSTVDVAEWDRITAESWAHAEGYTLQRWRQVTPEDLVADVAYLDGRLITDAPMGDLILEQERVDAPRVRAAEELMGKLGRRTYHSGARHDATGRLAAWTAISFEADHPTHAWQQITIVDPEHRGHRLGALVKVDNMHHVLEHEPQVRHIDTWNAAVNGHMIGINEAMGYRAVDGWVAWQAEV